MKKRLLAIAVTLAAVLGAIVLILAMLPPKPGVTKANFDRLAIGMTSESVQTEFGGVCTTGFTLHGPEEATITFGHWNGQDGHAVIQFNGNVEIVAMAWEDRPTSFYQKLQRWLPWLPD